MLFNSAAFVLLFLPVVAAVRALLPAAWRQRWLVCASVLLIATWGAWSLPGIAVSVAVAAASLRAFDRNHSRLGVITGIVVLALILIAPKAIAARGGSVDRAGSSVLLVIGVSFVVLNLMSVLIDRYRGRLAEPIALRDLVSFGVCFPYVAAGPLVRWRDVAPQLRAGRPVESGQVARAVLLIAVGLAKKTLLADPIGLRLDQLLSYGTPEGVVGSWLVAAAFGAQVYFDFSGYSDMALGIGLLLGLTLPPNFNAPYQAASIADFWRRWHMTLTSWVRDYVYLGLGIGRSHARAMVSMVIAMTVVGMWHGFAATFIVWGLYHGLLLAGYYALRATRVPMKVPEWLGRALTFGTVCVGWAIFRAASLPDAGSLVSSMAGLHGLGSLQLVRNRAGAMFLLLAAVGVMLTQILREPWQLEVRPRFSMGLAYGALFALAVMALGSRNPFIYLQY